MEIKKSKGVPFDKYFNNGLFELGRIGNLVSMKNHLSEEDIKKSNVDMADKYAVIKAEIDN